MSKKTRTAELIEARVVREREWCYARWMERMTYRQISAAAALPIEQGGLGISLSHAGAKAMVSTYREERGDVTMSRDERRERQSDEVDDRARRARYDLTQAHADLNSPRPVRSDFDDDVDYNSALVAWAKMYEGASKVVESADRRLAAAMKDERDLHGLAAPTEIKAEVVHRDAILDELAVELASIGEDVTT